MNKSILDYLHFYSPTTEQKNVLSALAKFVEESNQDDFLVLCGAAGTGKTSITSALIGYLNDSEVRYKIAAPTGRAALVQPAVSLVRWLGHRGHGVEPLGVQQEPGSAHHA